MLGAEPTLRSQEVQDHLTLFNNLNTQTENKLNGNYSKLKTEAQIHIMDSSFFAASHHKSHLNVQIWSKDVLHHVVVDQPVSQLFCDGPEEKVNQHNDKSHLQAYLHEETYVSVSDTSDSLLQTSLKV